MAQCLSQATWKQVLCPSSPCLWLLRAASVGVYFCSSEQSVMVCFSRAAVEREVSSAMCSELLRLKKRLLHQLLPLQRESPFIFPVFILTGPEDTGPPEYYASIMSLIPCLCPDPSQSLSGCPDSSQTPRVKDLEGLQVFENPNGLSKV